MIRYYRSLTNYIEFYKLYDFVHLINLKRIKSLKTSYKVCACAHYTFFTIKLNINIKSYFSTRKNNLLCYCIQLHLQYVYFIFQNVSNNTLDNFYYWHSEMIFMLRKNRLSLYFFVIFMLLLYFV